MKPRDLLLSIAAAELTGVFLLPTLFNTDSYQIIPFAPFVLFAGLPIITLLGMAFASVLSKKLGILWQLAKFGLVGVLNTAIDFGLLNFFIALTGVTSGFAIVVMNATSFSTAVVNSYFWNREWVFEKSKKSNFGAFFTVTLIGIGLNTGIVYFLTTFVSPVFVESDKVWANLAKVLATFISLTWNFLGYRLVVFRK